MNAEAWERRGKTEILRPEPEATANDVCFEVCTQEYKWVGYVDGTRVAGRGPGDTIRVAAAVEATFISLHPVGGTRSEWG